MPKTVSNTSGWYPLDNKCVIKPDEIEETSEGGIVLTDPTLNRDKQAQTIGTLVSIGPLSFEGWGVAPDVGAKVMFAKYAGLYETGEDGEDYRLVNDADIVAVRYS